MEVKMGFSGTREGMTAIQKDVVENIIDWFRPQEFRHGDCIGSDVDAHSIARKHEYIWIIGHPPIDPILRAYCDFDETRLPQEYKVRDKRIVIESNILVATPKEMSEVLRSGTWTTIRYAREAKIPVLIVKPTGSLIIRNLFGLDGVLREPMEALGLRTFE